MTFPTFFFSCICLMASATWKQQESHEVRTHHAAQPCPSWAPQPTKEAASPAAEASAENLGRVVLDRADAKHLPQTGSLLLTPADHHQVLCSPAVRPTPAKNFQGKNVTLPGHINTTQHGRAAETCRSLPPSSFCFTAWALFAWWKGSSRLPSCLFNYRVQTQGSQQSDA